MDSIIWYLVWFGLLGALALPALPAPVSLPADTPQPVITPSATPGLSLPPMPPAVTQLDRPFSLPFGATAVVRGGPAITFERVVDDSRCPADVLCVWSGMVVVALRIEPAGGETQTVEMGAITDYEGIVRSQQPQLGIGSSATLAAFTVELLAVTPYPAAAASPPELAQYAVQLVIRAADGSN
jgi:hypothetical protein